MEQNRTLLIVLLCFVAYLMYEAWQKDYNQKQQIASPATSSSTAQSPTEEARKPPGSELMPAPTATQDSTPSTTMPALSSNKDIEKGVHLSVQTDVYHAEIDTQGGDLVLLDLVKYPLHFNQKDTPFRLLDTSTNRYFVAQSGWFLSDDPDNKIVPGSRSVYKTDNYKYQLAENQNTLQVDLHWVNAQGIQFLKRYEFHRGSYVVDVKHIVNNPSEADFKANLYLRLQRNEPKTKGGFFMLPTFTGPVFYSPDKKYQKIKFSQIDDIKDQSVKDAINRDITGGWVAMIEQFFVGSWIPNDKLSFRYFTSRSDNGDHHYMIGMVTE